MFTFPKLLKKGSLRNASGSLHMKNFNFYSFIRRFVSVILTASLVFAAIPLISVGADEDYTLPWLWPVPGSFKINCLDYYYNGGIHNAGQCIDIGANGYTGNERLDVVSATTGTVLYIQNKYNETDNRGSGWGNYVIVKSGNTNIVYAHLKTVSCSYGEIKTGDIIGKMGNTGNSTGVHLHLQAYPSNEGSTSSKILVFEKFRTNPLYYKNFMFLSGLAEESIRYRDWIKEYYKTSGTYLSYSGGLENKYGFETVKLSAKVTVINTLGASVRSLPVEDNSYITDTIPNKNIINISEYYYDAYGKMWLLLKDGSGWISSTDVGFYDYNFSLSLSGESYPQGQYGSLYELPFDGKIVSDNLIASYTATLLRGSKIVDSYTLNVNSSEAFISHISGNFDIDFLSDGNYRFVLSVKEYASYPGVDPEFFTTELISSEFSINGELADKTAPVITKFEVSSADSNTVRLYCLATDNKLMSKVVFEACSSDGTVLKTSTVNRLSGNMYECEFSTLSLNGNGSYIFTVTAYDAFGNTSKKSKDFTLSSVGLSEAWKADVAVKIRTNPGTSYSATGTISKGTVVNITEITVSGGYIWGKHSKGWSALGEVDGSSYLTYQGGYLYSVNFNMNGDGATAPDEIQKKYGETVKLPSATPKRSGFKFLGWSKDSGAEAPEYRTDSEYSNNASVTLFAVWEDLTAPAISSVTASPTQWTNKPVIIEVKASDNGSDLFYSIDGGETWQSESSFTVTKNTVISTKKIAVKDAYGKITYWTGSVTVSNIDTTAPSVENAEIGISISGTNVSFNFANISDSESGISSYILEYSNDKSMSSAKTITLKSGTHITLSNGVYYAILKVTDKAGNTAEKELDRFRVGSPEKLAAVSGLSAEMSDTGTSLLSWDAVNNADTYTVEISDSESFSSKSVYSVNENKFLASGINHGKVYYFRVTAKSNDGLYLSSDTSASVSFTASNNDTTIYCFTSLSDAEIDADNLVAAYTAHYSSSILNLTVTVDKSAQAEYFSDSSLTKSISNPESYSFKTNSETVYIKVSAESGSTAVYTLKIQRAAEIAATPAVNFAASNETVYVGENPKALSLTASSSDNGQISVSWYMSYNGSPAVKIGEGNTLNPICDKAGSYSIYAIVTNTNTKCSTESSSFKTDICTVNVKKISTVITVSCPSKNYDGKTPSPTVSGYTGDGDTVFTYYSDPNCLNKIHPPVNAGKYYITVSAAETDKYLGCSGETVEFEIYKLENTKKPVYELLQPTIRDNFGYFAPIDENIEYRIIGETVWTLTEPEDTLKFSPNTKIEIRFAEQTNIKAGEIFTVEFVLPSLAMDFIPKDWQYLQVDSNGFLYVLRDGNTADMILSGFENKNGMVIYSPDEAVVGANDTVGTGYKITIEDSEGIFKSLTVIVLGDLDGNGTVEKDDAMNILYFSNGMQKIEKELDFLASDVDMDGSISSADAYKALLKT